MNLNWDCEEISPSFPLGLNRDVKMRNQVLRKF